MVCSFRRTRAREQSGLVATQCPPRMMITSLRACHIWCLLNTHIFGVQFRTLRHEQAYRLCRRVGCMDRSVTTGRLGRTFSRKHGLSGETHKSPCFRRFTLGPKRELGILPPRCVKLGGCSQCCLLGICQIGLLLPRWSVGTEFPAGCSKDCGHSSAGWLVSEHHSHALH